MCAFTSTTATNYKMIECRFCGKDENEHHNHVLRTTSEDVCSRCAFHMADSQIVGAYLADEDLTADEAQEIAADVIAELNANQITRALHQQYLIGKKVARTSDPNPALAAAIAAVTMPFLR